MSDRLRNGFVAFISVLNGGTTTDLDPAWSRIAALVPNVLAFVAFGSQARRVRGIEQRQPIAEALELVRLSHLADRYPHEHRAESAFAGTPRCWPIPIGPPPCG
jgi:hypothetical protein